MTASFKALSALLTYPSEELKAALPEIGRVLRREGLVEPATWQALADFLEAFVAEDLLELQQRYAFLFDRTRSLSLHLFEHVHGESRERGQAMVDLQALYERQGLQIAARELPDFLPLFLEFLSLLPLAEARELLEQPLHIVVALRERLEKRGSGYATVLRAVESLATERPARAAIEALLQQPDDDPADLAALDRIWEEEAVTFGGRGQGEGDCGPDRIRRQLRAAQRPTAPPAPATRGG
jgi:nitrate reductase delta subunit